MREKNAARPTLDDALQAADRIAAAGGDEFAQWLAAYLTATGSRIHYSEAELFAAWQDFQRFKSSSNTN